MVQHHIFYADIPMDVFAIVDAVTMQQRRFYVGIPLNVFDN